MCLCLLAVEGVAHVGVFGGREVVELEGGAGGEGDAFVSGAEEDVEGGGGLRGEGFGVGGAEGGEERGAVEVAGLEEVGRLTAGFEGEGAEGEDLGADAGLEEGLLVGGEGGGGHCGGDGGCVCFVGRIENGDGVFVVLVGFGGG